MLKEITAFAVIAAIGNPDLLAVHIILNLIVPGSPPVRVVSVDNLERTERVKGGAQVSSRFRLSGDKEVKPTDATWFWQPDHVY